MARSSKPESDSMTTRSAKEDSEAVFFCDRCGAILRPGTGNFYQIRIEAVADPTPPVVSAEDEPAQLRRGIEQLLAQMEELSAQEAMDQVYRRVMLYLCIPCCRLWIENPTGTLNER
jgi:hypothetical protein